MKKGEEKSRKVRRVRLSIILPALLFLFTIGVGVSNYQFAEFFLEASKEPEAQRLLNYTSRYILISSLVITMFALLVGIVITLSIIKPLRRVAQSAQMVVSGNLPPKIDIAITDEMRQLGQSFNQLVDYLRDLFEERDHYILDGTAGAVILTDSRGKIKALNPAAEQIIKIKSEKATGKTFPELEGEIEPYLLNSLKRILQNKVESEILRWTDREQKKCALIATTSCLGDKTRGLENYIINLRDITELESFYEGLQRADTLAAIGALAAGVSHEIRNPLTSIKSLAQLISTKLDNKEKIKEYLGVLNDEIKRIDNVVGAILEMAEPKPDPYERCDVNRLLAEALLQTRRSKFAAKLHLLNIVEDYSLLPFVLLPAESMTRAFYNILENAIEATPSGGSIRLKTCRISMERDSSILRIIISNTGSFIPEAERERIFQPFYSTKPGGKGLGLSVAYQIITYNSGSLRAESNEEGTSFIIEFPLEKIIAAKQD